jgi:hypothetical protein
VCILDYDVVVLVNLEDGVIMSLRNFGHYATKNTWGLKENMINKLMIFERKIMMKISGPTRTDDGYWRIKTNQ